MSNELVKHLNKLADDLESAATIEAEVERVNKIAHMISAINGLSILKEAAIGLEAGIMSNLYGQSANYPYQQVPAPRTPTPRRPGRKSQSFADKIKKGIKNIFPGKSDKINKIKSEFGEKINELESAKKSMGAELANKEWESMVNAARAEQLGEMAERYRKSFGGAMSTVSSLNKKLESATENLLQSRNLQKNLEEQIRSKDINIRNLKKDTINSALKIHVLRQTRSNLENQINLLTQQYEKKLTEAQRGNILAKHEADALRKELELRSNAMNNLQEQISTYEARLGLAQKTIGNLQGEAQGLRRTIGGKERQIQELFGELGSTQKTLGTTGEHLRYTRATNKRLYDAMAKLTEENKALKVQAAMGSREAAKRLEENTKIINNLQEQIAVGETRLGLAQKTIGDLQSKIENLENVKKNLEARVARGEYAAAKDLEVVKNELAKNQKLIGRLKSEKGIAEKMLASEKAKSLFTKFLESPLRTRALVAGVPLAALGLTGYGAYRLGKNKREGLLDRLGIN